MGHEDEASDTTVKIDKGIPSETGKSTFGASLYTQSSVMHHVLLVYSFIVSSCQPYVL